MKRAFLQHAELYDALANNDVSGIQSVIGKELDAPDLKDVLNNALCSAARKGFVQVMRLLVEHGADVNAPQVSGLPGGPITSAAGEGAIDAVRWLLDQSAEINHIVNGKARCPALATAVFRGHLDVVKLLVEHGAAINADSADMNALSFAITYRHKDIETYLRSKGALEPWQVKTQESADIKRGITHPVLKHLKKHRGKPQPLAMHELIPGEPAISIQVIPMNDCCMLSTIGMSDRAMTAPENGGDYRFAELGIYLPPEWPLDDGALTNPNFSWPVEWLRRIAHYPFENGTWLGGPSAVIANGEPPQPLAPNCKMSSILLLSEDTSFGRLNLPDGRSIVFYTLYPLYSEERELEQQEGILSLLDLFEKHEVHAIVNVNRRNLCRLTQNGKKLEDGRV